VTHCSRLSHAATNCNILQHIHQTQKNDTRPLLSSSSSCNTMQQTATHCNTQQHAATHCNTLPHTATRCDILLQAATRCNTNQILSMDTHPSPSFSTTLQHTATHCDTLQHTAAHCSGLPTFTCTYLQHIQWILNRRQTPVARIKSTKPLLCVQPSHCRLHMSHM